MRHGRGVGDEGPGVADVDHQLEQLERVEERGHGLGAAGQVEGEHRADAVREVAGGQRRAGMPGHAGVVHPRDRGVPGQVFGHGQGGGGVAGHAQVERLEPLDELRRARGGEGGAEVVQELAAGQRQVGAAAVPLDQRLPAVAGLGPGQLRPPVRRRAVVERAAVHDRAAEHRAVPAEELGGGVHDDVGAVLQRPVEGRRREGAVHHHGHTGRVGEVRERGQVREGGKRVGDGLEEERAGVGSDRGGPRGRVRRVREGDLDAEVRERVRQQVHGAAVELAGGDQVLAALQQRQQGQRDGGLAGGRGDRADAALQRGEAVLEHRDGRVARAAVGEAGGLEPEHRCRCGVVRETERRGLVDGRDDRPVGRGGLVAGMDLLCGVTGHLLSSIGPGGSTGPAVPGGSGSGGRVAAASSSQISRPLWMGGEPIPRGGPPRVQRATGSRVI